MLPIVLVATGQGSELVPFAPSSCALHCVPLHGALSMCDLGHLSWATRVIWVGPRTPTRLLFLGPITPGCHTDCTPQVQWRFNMALGLSRSTSKIQICCWIAYSVASFNPLNCVSHDHLLDAMPGAWIGVHLEGNSP
jgi:hypothetical protein